MKKSILVSFLIVMGVLAKANDLIVEENGLAPSYDSITTALRAANSGDRIFIKNKAGNIPWVENITITKSISLLSYVADSFFIVQGSYIISPSVVDTVTIIGMINLTAGIGGTTPPAGGTRSVVRILGCQLASGAITFGASNYDLTVEGCTVGGTIQYEHGSIIGNSIIAGGISALSEGTVTADTSYIMGNIVSGTISWTSNTMYFDIRNNYIIGIGQYGIEITSTSGGASLQKVYNNTVNMANQNYSPIYGIYVTGSANSQIDVQNNLVGKSYASNSPSFYGIYGVYASGGNLSATYNSTTAGVNGTLTVNLDNTNPGTIAFGVNGVTTVGINAGNPGPQFYNTNLTANTVGCYGGSFTMSNFLPLFANAPTTWLTNYQFNLRTGNTLNIKASSFSK